ncbi:MAG: hypothetical protein KJ804_05035 [Proteobacteria bacterium]|nr:hypothetical protein [Pseudomonadota bacterium]MBU1057668.1 hypothetical protein [Pseudomonadota bacterium]
MTENRIRQEQIDSYGRLMAGFAHDMKNHLGIIRESNGLMADLVEMGGLAEDEKVQERLKKSIAAIERRVVLAADMFHSLSCFSHRSDTPYSSFQLNDLIREECVFLERFSRLKQIEVVLELGDGLHALYNDPSLLHHVLYRMYNKCLTQMESGHKLLIITEQEGAKSSILFRLQATPQIDVQQLFDAPFLATIQKLDGTLEGGASTKEYTEIRLLLSSLSLEGK